MRTISYLPMAAALVLGACVTVPTAPSVVALPGTHKTFEQFQADQFACQQYAQQVIGVPADQAANNAVGSAVAGTAIGAAAGAIIGSASGNAGPGAAIGAGTGLLVGSAAGSNYYGASYYGLQRRYDGAYLQCMYAKGNQIPVRAGRYRSAPPGYYPPPAG
ncbi:MAG TPA: YMGG-like glycine zipper-containing protein [Casimicrobiaceae bacterium]|nr:YMGG-like glycine zipper-containing protein [Casimicrobiaceae bacterium]